MKLGLKTKLTSFLSKSAFGHEFLFQGKKILNRIPHPDYQFPLSISLELASLCNLSCIHCPPKSAPFKELRRPYGMMQIDLFERLMTEIDQQGIRHIALHKDGEPLLHPKIIDILQRVKRDQEHVVYLSTNAHRLNKEIGESILTNRINTINFSIGAFSKSFYQKVRGPGFEKVITNIHNFLGLLPKFTWQPRVQVQIIYLPEFPEMKEEIKNFKKYWREYSVEVQVWDKLNWGVLDTPAPKMKRYPCFSLWKYLFVNSDGKVSACCVDWKQDLVVGNAWQSSLAGIWVSPELKNLRQHHFNHEEAHLPLCAKCNYWSWLPKLSEYRA